MRVLLDDQIFLRQRRGGVSRYFAELWRHFHDLPQGVMTQDFRWHFNVHARDAGIPGYLPAIVGRFPAVPRWANRLGQAPLADVSHHTYYDVSYIERSNARVKVVTVYDMIPELFPELYENQANPHAGKEACVKAADLVLCISESTANDLVRLFGVDAQRVVVTPLGVDPKFNPAATPPTKLPSQFVLYVGNRRGYKDFNILVEAFASVAAKQPDLWLLAASGSDFSLDERNALAAAGVAQRTRHLSVDDDGLAGLYAAASCFVFPSRYEGFGLPTLEAMSCACPVLLARSSSHVEVGGDAALYFAPGDAADLRERLLDVLTSPELRGTLKPASVAQAARFSWLKTAQTTMTAYTSSL